MQRYFAFANWIGFLVFLYLLSGINIYNSHIKNNKATLESKQQKKNKSTNCRLKTSQKLTNKRTCLVTGLDWSVKKLPLEIYSPDSRVHHLNTYLGNSLSKQSSNHPPKTFILDVMDEVDISSILILIRRGT